MKTALKKTPLIYLITQGAATKENFTKTSAQILELIRRAVAAKINLIQIREKKLSAKLVFKLAVKAVELSRDSATEILINDRADIALAANAGGVHLTSQSLPPRIIRQNFPSNLLVGVSAHTLAEAATARTDSADFVTFSPIFTTPSKENYGAPQGLEKLAEVCRKLEPFPIIALGGIDKTNFTEVIKRGARGFAAIRFLSETENLPKIVADSSKISFENE